MADTEAKTLEHEAEIIALIASRIVAAQLANPNVDLRLEDVNIRLAVEQAGKIYVAGLDEIEAWELWKSQESPASMGD